ncbi:MAG TPA: phenylalanine--tRNA ligase subunit beta, partial [Balneolaceae bacterium]|nr:phenylalanine--tRNA ligase subunit beta [Balneolaceae bacterium]
MKISYKWLKDFIDLKLNPEETAEKLTLIGLEVDEVLQYGNLLTGVVVGKVLEVFNHPNADRLVLCKVDLGTEQVQIACGAPNVAAGQSVPVATTGTALPTENGEPFTIKKAKLRGEISEGMICSESELQLGEDHSGIMVLNDDFKPGTPLHEALNLTADTVFDIELTPNRADAASHLGVARDLAAALNLELKKPFKPDFGETNPDKSIDISIQNEQKCHRYVGKEVRGIKVQPSPRWLKDRLQAVGIRPVNNIVDVTNFVMLETGQPL